MQNREAMRWVLIPLLGFITLGGAAAQPSSLGTRDDVRRVIDRGSSSELARFAAWFGQDWALMFGDFYEGASMYLDELSASESETLHEELTAFLVKYETASPAEIREAWIELGAEAVQPGLDLPRFLRDVCEGIPSGDASTR